MSDDMRKAVCSLLAFLEIVAKQTKNPIDDMVVRAAMAVFGCITPRTPDEK